MSQEKKMKVNPIPAKTWYWLKVNDAEVTLSKDAKMGTAKEEIPRDISLTTVDGLDQIKTGMGPEILEDMNEHGVEGKAFVAKAGTNVKEPVRICICPGDKKEMFRYGIYGEKDSEVTVIMLVRGDGDGELSLLTQIRAEENARVRLVQVYLNGGEATCVNDIGGEAEKNARIEVVHIFLGGNPTMSGCHIALNGKGSSHRADVGFMQEGHQQIDMNYVASHVGKKTVSEIYDTGVLKEEARKIFRGTIDFIRGCSEASGTESEEVLLMDDTVINRTVPTILCGEEDVEGNHGATIGKLADDLVFYLESRGMSKEEIYQMVAIGKIIGVAHQIEDEETEKQVADFLGVGEED